MGASAATGPPVTERRHRCCSRRRTFGRRPTGPAPRGRAGRSPWNSPRERAGRAGGPPEAEGWRRPVLKGGSRGAEPCRCAKARGVSEVRVRGGQILSSIPQQAVSPPKHPFLGAGSACLTKREGKMSNAQTLHSGVKMYFSFQTEWILSRLRCPLSGTNKTVLFFHFTKKER